MIHVFITQLDTTSHAPMSHGMMQQHAVACLEIYAVCTCYAQHV